MTTAADTPIIRYDGNDATTEFSVPFYFDADEELKVTHRLGDQDTLLMLNTDYTATGEGTRTGHIDFPKGGSSFGTLATGERLTIERVTDLDRTVDVAGAYFHDTLNDGDDKMMRQIQDLSQKVNRAALQTAPNSDAVPSTEDILAATSYGFSVQTLTFNIKSGAVITTGFKNIKLIAPQSGTFNQWTIVSMLGGVAQAGDLEVEVYKNDVKISASDPIKLDNESKKVNVLLTGWTKTFSSGDEFTIKIIGTPAVVQNADIFGNYTVTGA
jgi:hypothetical protein